MYPNRVRIGFYFEILTTNLAPESDLNHRSEFRLPSAQYLSDDPGFTHLPIVWLQSPVKAKKSKIEAIFFQTPLFSAVFEKFLTKFSFFKITSF